VIFAWNVYPLWRVTQLEEKASTLNTNGNYKESEAVLRKALQLAETRWDESNTAPVLYSLAISISLQERWYEAEPYAKRALVIYKRTHGPTNALVGVTLKALSDIKAGQAKYDEARAYHQELESILLKEETHPELSNPAMRESLRNYVEELNTLGSK
jgi:tetratricopeptide (TPR) repeat protein